MLRVNYLINTCTLLCIEGKKALISGAQLPEPHHPLYRRWILLTMANGMTRRHFHYASIVFLPELDNANQSSGWNGNAYRLEKNCWNTVRRRDLSLSQCYTFHETDNKHHLIFMSVPGLGRADGKKPYAYIMYMNIGSITHIS